MAQSAPHYNLRKIINKMNALAMFIFWVIFVLSVIPILLKRYAPTIDLDDEVNAVNVVCICLFFVIDITCEYILIPMADTKRRDDFIDNAFGSTFTPNPSVDYFTNDNLPTGIYKAASNLFENCFFTYNLVKAVVLQKIVLPAVIMLVIAASAWYGFKQVPFALSLLQVLFSTKLLGTLLKHCILLVKLDQIQDGLINLFQQPNFKADPAAHQQTFYRLWLKYEALHSSTPAEIPDSVFKKLNPAIGAEWIELKTRYNITYP